MLSSSRNSAGHSSRPRCCFENRSGRLSREIRAVLEQPDLSKRLVDLGGTLHPTTPEEMRRYIEAEISKWKRIVAARKIQVE